MSLETEVRELCGSLISNRANERKKAAESLKRFLETGKAVPCLLTQNTKKKNGYSWNHVFEDIHAFVIKETEKFETSKTFPTVTSPLCTNLLHLCVSGANNGHAYIKCEKLTEACLHILVDNRLSKAVGDAYLSLLYKHILPNENYLMYISPTTWENLLDACLSSCCSTTSMLDSVMKLKLVWLIIKNATNYCQFVIPLRDSLSKIKRYIVKHVNDKKIHEIEIIILILETLHAECRLTMCEFMEGVLPSIFQFYNQNLDQKTKSSLFKLLEMTIMLHHPQGRARGSSGSLAHNWDIWDKHLNSILEIICSEIAFKQKQSDHSVKQCPHFSYTAAAIMHQVFVPLEKGNDNDCESLTKKPKTNSNNNKCFKDLIQELERNSVPWIGIIHSYVKNFGLHVSSVEYVSLIAALERIMSSEKTTKIDWQEYEDLSIITIDKMWTCQDGFTKDSVRLISFWNCCVRYSGSTNLLHKSVHNIMLSIMKLNVLNYQQVEPLLSLYLEERMPANKHSLSTLICILNKFYSKCCSNEIKLKCLKWLIHERIIEMDPLNVKELLIKLITNHNITLHATDPATSYEQYLYITLFESIDRNILFSEFEEQQKALTASKEKVQNKVEVNFIVSNEVNDRLEQMLTQYMTNLGSKDVTKLEYAQMLHLIIHYFDVILTYTTMSIQEVESINLFVRLNDSLRKMYGALKETLQSHTQMRYKIRLLQCLQSMLHNDYHMLLNYKLRNNIGKDCFTCINSILNSDLSNEEDQQMYEEDDTEIDTRSLKHNCILFLAEYCRKKESYTNELLSCILDSDLYDFKFQYDVDCAFRCFELLSGYEVEEPPLDLAFNLMVDMCKHLFRNPRASQRLLKLLQQILDRVWANANDDTKKNLVIMLKSYLQRSTNRYYPPHTAVLVYECVAKLIHFSYEQNLEYENSFKEILFRNINDAVHNIRIFSCYLLKTIGSNFSQSDIQYYMDSLTKIFVIDAQCSDQSILTDESANRTSTLLHGFYGLTQAKQCLIHDVITTIALFQVEKKLDKHKVRKVLSFLLNDITSNTVDVYISNNITNILYFWFLKNKHIDVLPVYLFGYDNLDVFLERHVKWIIAADILWYNKGDVQKSTYLKRVAEKTSAPMEDIIEMCFCNLLTLCLPYIVSEKYKIDMEGIEANITGNHANRLLQITRLLLKEEKWNNLFVENLGELVLMAASNFWDLSSAQIQYQINIPQRLNTFTYSKEIFLAILKYFGEIVDGNITHFLCTDQPLAILHILFKLCGNVLREKVFETKILYLSSYLIFIDLLPLGCPSDAILCNFAFVSLLHAIQDSKKKEEVRIFIKGLQKILKKVLAHDVHILQKSVVSKAVSILTVKKEADFANECDPLLTYLTTNLKEHFKDGADVVDFVSAISGGNINSNLAGTIHAFKDTLQAFALGLNQTSIATLINMRIFLKNNRHFVNILCEELGAAGFSEECETSVIHRVVFAICNIIKSSSDDKMKIEACNCLAEIGTYDIKTLVTVSPANTRRIVNTVPKQYFANVALKSCSNILFYENPSTSNKVIEAISHILKYTDGKKALDSEDIDKNMLKCLSQSNGTSSIKFPIDSAKLQLYGNLDYWVPRNAESHTQWILRITTAILDILISPANFISSLREVCMTKPIICSEILPSLTGLVLHYSAEVGVLIGRQLNRVFENIWNTTIDRKEEINILDYDQKMIVHYMLDVVNFVRVQAQHHEMKRVSPCESYNYLKLNYDKVSWAASIADQHLDAIYYGELWAVAVNGGVPPACPEDTSALEGGHHIQDIFRTCFASIGEPDAAAGCGTAHLRSGAGQRRHCRHADALLLHDIELARCGPRPDLALGLVAAMHHAGMHYLALHYIQSYPDDDRLSDIKYDCLSYLGDWSNFVDTRELREKLHDPSCQPNSILKAYRYACLKDCLNIQSSENFALRLKEPLDGAKLAAAKLCESLNMENCQSVYQVVENLHLFRDIEQYNSVRSGIISMAEFISDWNVSKLPTFKEFKHIESLITQRSVILSHAAENYDTFKADIAALQLQYAELGLSNERIQMAQRVLSLVKDVDTSGRVQLVESQISWAKDYKDIALSLLLSVISNSTSTAKLSAESFRQYGLWMAECKRENTRDIINKYLEKSLEFSNIGNDLQTKTKVSYDIAKFADEEYKQVATYMKSQIFENKVKCMKSIKDTAATFRGTQGLTGEERKAWATNNAFGEIEEADISNTIAERSSFLIFAMRYYLLSLTQSDDYNLSIFRVVSLWLENSSLDLEDEENGRLGDLIHSIPSWKFLTVLPQLAPRLSNDDTPFAVNLKAIIKRCAEQHPHHTLPMLFSLKNSDADACSPESVRSGRGQASGEARVLAASALLAALPTSRPELAPALAQMERLCDAIIRFAYLAPNKRELRQAVPRGEPLAALRGLDAVPPPTDAVPVRKDGDYAHIVTLSHFEKYYELVGGINCPKKISCYCSDGKKRIILIKGQDDLRQDAMMQQVFNIVNTLLEKNPVTNRNKLYICTYKVVPMSRQSGVLEWCEGTTPLGIYLVDAHSRLRPQDMSSSAARTKLVECHENKKSNEKKLQVFLEILKHFRPIFHFFFTEHFLDPVTWYERRLAYTRSVAASSMVGYIMGLGDRHVKNILIDKCTAEVIHIDFGIAFDQGKTLRTPETVPFRLTQDIIAGFGCNGVEGVFRRCCEKTLQLLRDNQETLLTILEVLLCDPLHSWAVSDKKLRENSVQCAEEVPVGALAERALLAVRRKLSGGRGGRGGAVSAPGHAARLIARAADPANLCRLFPGWQPYL